MLDTEELINHNNYNQRYLPADKVDIPSRAPQFVEAGHCQWCNKPFPKGSRSRLYCPMSDKSIFSNISDCAYHFLNWWCSRPAYVRATLIRDDFTCQNCGLHPMREDKPWLPDISQLEADHIVPIARGGITEMSNLQTLCRSCNRRKGTREKAPEPSKQIELNLDI